MELILHNFIVHSRALSIVFQHLFHSILIRIMVLFYRSKFLQWLLKLMNSRLAVQQFSICQFNLIHNQTIPALKLNENHCFWWSKQIFFCGWTFFYFFIYYICLHFYCFGSLKVFVCFFFAVVFKFSLFLVWFIDGKFHLIYTNVFRSIKMLFLEKIKLIANGKSLAVMIEKEFSPCLSVL